jgi:hypothetical protein
MLAEDEVIYFIIDRKTENSFRGDETQPGGYSGHLSRKCRFKVEIQQYMILHSDANTGLTWSSTL